MTTVVDATSVEVAAQTAASDVAASLHETIGGGDEGKGRRLSRHGCGRWGGRIERMRLLDDCVATAASGFAFCSGFTWPRSLFISVDAAGATVDIHPSSCTRLVQLRLDLSVPNHSSHERNSLPFLACRSRALPQQFLVRKFTVKNIIHCQAWFYQHTK